MRKIIAWAVLALLAIPILVFALIALLAAAAAGVLVFIPGVIAPNQDIRFHSSKEWDELRAVTKKDIDDWF